MWMLPESWPVVAEDVYVDIIVNVHAIVYVNVYVIVAAYMNVDK